MNPTQITVTADPVTPAATLRCAGTYLARHGWHQGDMFADPDQPTPPACALGAIRMATLGSAVVDAERLDMTALGEFDAAVAALADHVILCQGHVDPDMVDVLDGGMEQVVAEWNDEPDRNVAQVLAAMHGAANDWDRTHVRVDGSSTVAGVA